MNRALKIAILVVVVLAVSVGGFLWWFFKDDAPAEVSLEDAVAAVTTSTSADTAGTTAPVDDSDDTDGSADTTPPLDEIDGITGTWTIDGDTGEFDYESATGTFVGFRIEEELSAIGSTTAVGRTGDVSGSMTIDETTVTEASFEIDLATITTNESRRDSKVRGALDTSTFPTATLVLTEPIELGDDAANGQPVTVTATGDLTMHGVTQPVQFALEAQLVDTTVVVVGSTEVVFSDYDIRVPTSPAVLSVEDHATLELQFLLVQQ